MKLIECISLSLTSKSSLDEAELVNVVAFLNTHSAIIARAMEKEWGLPWLSGLLGGLLLVSRHGIPSDLEAIRHGEEI